MGIDGSLEVLFSYCGLHLFYVMYSGQYCVVWMCAHTIMAHTLIYAAFSYATR